MKTRELHRRAQAQLIEKAGEQSCQKLCHAVMADYNQDSINPLPYERALWAVTNKIEERLQLIAWQACAAPLINQPVSRQLFVAFAASCRELERRLTAQYQPHPRAKVVEQLCHLTLPETDELRLLYAQQDGSGRQYLLWPTDDAALLYITDALDDEKVSDTEKGEIASIVSAYRVKRTISLGLQIGSPVDEKTTSLDTLRGRDMAISAIQSPRRENVIPLSVMRQRLAR